MREKYTFIVVGGGIAGVSCVESLLTWLPQETVLLLSSTATIKATTNAVNLSKTLVTFDVEQQSAEEFAKKHPGLDILIEQVICIDSSCHQVTTESGKLFKYARLCLCLGGKPNLIAEGNDFVVGIRDTDSVDRLRERLGTAKRVVICGNGGIASELVYEIGKVDKVWVVKDQHISSVFLDAGAAQFMQGCLSKTDGDMTVKKLKYTGGGSSAALGPDWLVNSCLHGHCNEEKLTIEYGAFVESITNNAPGSEYPVQVRLDTGKVIDADLVISATGVVPCGDAVSVTPSLELAADGGIVVDEMLRTSVADVYGAGDVVTAGWPRAQHWVQMRLWTQARQMGQFAGRAMSASLTNEPVLQDFCFEIFSHVTRFFSRRVILLGLFNGQKLNGDCDFVVRVTPGKEYVKLVMQRGKIQGAVLIGDTDLEEMCENLILDQLDVGFLGEQILDPDVDVEDYFD